MRRVLSNLWILILMSLSISSLYADSEANKLLGDDIPDWQARLELARVLSYQKKYDESIKEYLTVLKEKPGLEEAQVELATVYAYNEQPEEALAIVKTLSREKETPKRIAEIAHIFATLKMYDQAEELYRAYLAQVPDDLKIQVRLAEMLSWAKRYQESIQLFERVLQQKPNDIQVRRKYAFALIWAGDEDRGAEELRKTLKD